MVIVVDAACAAGKIIAKQTSNEKPAIAQALPAAENMKLYYGLE